MFAAFHKRTYILITEMTPLLRAWRAAHE